MFRHGPETNFQYQEPTWVVAQHVILTATGMGSWQDFLQNFFGEPLGLKYAPRYQPNEEGHLPKFLQLKILDEDAKAPCLFGIERERSLSVDQGGCESYLCYGAYEIS